MWLTPVPSFSRHPCVEHCTVVPGGRPQGHVLQPLALVVKPWACALRSISEVYSVMGAGSPGYGIVPLSSHTVVSGMERWPDWLSYHSSITSLVCLTFFPDWKACQLWLSTPVSNIVSQVSGPVTHVCSLACFKVKLREGSAEKEGTLPDIQSVFSLWALTELYQLAATGLDSLSHGHQNHWVTIWYHDLGIYIEQYWEIL